MTKVSVVIRCFNEEEHIGRLLSGIYSQTVVPDEVIIVDSGSTDGTLDIAAQFPVKIDSIDQARFSFGRSLNQGIALSTNPVVVIASAHVYPIYRTWIERLIQPLITDQGVAVSYGRQVGNTDSHFSEIQVMSNWFPTHSNPDQQHPFCNNANAAIRRSVWDRLHYDEQLTGLEDLEWARRAMGNGMSVAYVAEAPVVHVHHETFRQILNRYRREAIAHKVIYPEQEMGLFHAIGLTALNVALDYWHALRGRQLHQNIFSIPRFRLAQFAGTYRGFKQRGPVTQSLRHRFYYPSRVRTAPAAIDNVNDELVTYGEVDAEE